jgi:hypothetical protein
LQKTWDNSKLEDIKMGNLNDCWLKLYVYLAKGITVYYGIEGEAALRRGIRSFGLDRGQTLRNEQIKLGMKINMYNLWTYYDLPDDKRFRRNKIKLDTQERISETLVCPMANMWIKMNEKRLGAIYCDEFHPAMFSGYHSKIVTNLGQTLTHETDDHCHFALFLRPGNMTEEERKMSFIEYDPEYDESQVGAYVMRTPKEGYNMLTIKLYYHLANETIQTFGEDARKVIHDSVAEWAEDIARFLAERADAVGEQLSERFIDENCPVNLDISKDILWEEYDKNRIKELFVNSVYENFVPALCLEMEKRTSHERMHGYS